MILRVSMLGKPLELARLTGTASDVFVCVDCTKDFSCDLSRHISLALLETPCKMGTDLGGESFTEVLERAITVERS